MDAESDILRQVHDQENLPTVRKIESVDPNSRIGKIIPDVRLMSKTEIKEKIQELTNTSGQPILNRLELVKMRRFLNDYDQLTSSENIDKTQSPPENYQVLPYVETEGRYQLTELISDNGYDAQVYKAKDQKLVRECIVKIYPGGKSVLSLEKETKVVSHLHHPNIAQPLGFQISTLPGEADPSLIFVQEYIEGETLAELIDKKKLNFNQIVTIVKELAQAIDYLAAHGIDHGDLTPNNIMFRGNHPVLIDFGLSKLALREELITQLKQESRIMGTPNYQTPEKIELANNDDKGILSSVFILGVITYEMLLSKTPFEGENNIETLTKIRDEEIPGIAYQIINSDYPTVNTAALKKALEKKPDLRYSTATEFADDLLKLNHTVSVIKPTP